MRKKRIVKLSEPGNNSVTVDCIQAFQKYFFLADNEHKIYKMMAAILTDWQLHGVHGDGPSDVPVAANQEEASEYPRPGCLKPFAS